ncbi:helix-turn-helix domain-containing protein [Spirillospora sp. CA-294931]|uniref:helix-turn-helix domain-containing protein n=1 Tax=Spirillospora sp. CA-294931 TaxID=3240042 RepID=UPI003D8FD727
MNIPEWAMRLQTEREARGWSKHQMARELMNAAGVRHGSVVNLARQVLDWEKGKHFPRDWAESYACAFEMDLAELFPSLEGCEASSDGSVPDDEVRRRTLLGMVAAAASAPLGVDAEPVRTVLTEAITTRVTARDADEWERVAFDYAHEVGFLPARQVLPDLVTDFNEINLLISHAVAEARLRLVHTAAQLAALTAITLISVGDARSARRWWRTAARAADESGDPGAASLVRGRAAVFSLYGGWSAMTTLDLAKEAIEIGRNTPCVGVVSGYAARAQALAHLGRGAEATEALNVLADTFVRLPDASTQHGRSQWTWPEQRLHHVKSHVHTFAGNPEEAHRAQDRALAFYSGQSQGRAQVELHRAGALLRAGEIQEGARYMVRVMEGLPGALAHDGLVRSTARSSLGLAPRAATRQPAVLDAYELLAETSGDQ